MNKKNKKTLLMAGWLGILAILAIGLYFIGKAPQISGPPPPPPPPPPTEVLKKAWPQILQMSAAPPFGHKNARYTLVEFGDFQCPQCGVMEPEIFGFVSKNLNNVNMYFVHRPFPFHKWAISAAETAQIANAHGKFWPMYQILYKNQSNLEPGFMAGYSAQVGISAADFAKDQANPQYKTWVDQSEKVCDKLGVNSTPTLAIMDNKTGDIQIAVGRTDIQKLLPSLKWAKPGSDVPAPQPSDANESTGA